MTEKYIYIYEMPYKVRQRLVDVLNVNEVWKDLAGIYLNYGQIDIEKLRRAENRPGCSPADALLTKMGQKNQTTLQLFRFLYKMKHYQAMEIMKDCIDSKYHKHIKDRFAAPEFSQSINFSSSSQIGKSVPIPPKEYQNAKNPNLEMDISFQKKFDAKKIFESFPSGNQNQNLGATQFSESTFSTTDNNFSTMKETANTNGAAYLAPAQGLNVLSSGQGNLSSGKTVEASCSRLKQRVPSGIPTAHPDIRLRSLTFEEVKKACNNFSRSNLIGRGGFGEVYQGEWNGQKVAVKRIREDKRLENDSAYHRYLNQALTELYALHQYPAENILPLWAFHFDDCLRTDPCLVYQFMSNGSVSDRLQRKNNTPSLSWNLRANIALGTARGLCHLHANNIIHGDIKSPNILLDKHFEPKIGDFGLARGGPDVEDITHKIVTIIQGTESYLPYDYVRSHQLSPEVDTFSFGIFLFELVTGKSPSWKVPNTKFQLRDVMLRKIEPWQWIDQSPGEESQWPNTLYFLGTDCARDFRQDRPKMDRIYTALDRIIKYPESLALQKLYDMRNLQSGGQNRPEDHKKTTVFSEPGAGATSLHSANEVSSDESQNIPVFLVGDETLSKQQTSSKTESYFGSSNVSSESTFSESTLKEKVGQSTSQPSSIQNLARTEFQEDSTESEMGILCGALERNLAAEENSLPKIPAILNTRPFEGERISQNPIIASLQRGRGTRQADPGIPDLPQFTEGSELNIPNLDALGSPDTDELSLSPSSQEPNATRGDDSLASSRLASAEHNIEHAAHFGIFK